MSDEQKGQCPSEIKNVMPIYIAEQARVENCALEELAKQCQKRGNRLEVMNGKVYEVSRKLIGQLNNQLFGKTE